MVSEKQYITDNSNAHVVNSALVTGRPSVIERSVASIMAVAARVGRERKGFYLAHR